MTDRQHDKPVDGASLDNLWDFGDPAGSEARFQAQLGQLDPNGIAAAELTTQLAPALAKVAESSAFGVLAHYGIDIDSYSFPYVARWAEDKAVLKRNLAEVQEISATVI